MEKKENLSKLAVQMYGAKALKDLLNQMPVETMFVAISRNKFASIFYKHHLGEFDVDYRNGHGWTGARQLTVQELEQDLNAISFILVDVDDLRKELVNYPDEIAGGSPLSQQLNGLIECQITRAQMRLNADNGDTYWKGHLDAYAIIQNAIQPHL